MPPLSCKVYTPVPLARALVGALGDGESAKWLEPSVGLGAFLQALTDLGIPPDRITAVDLETTACPTDRLANTERGTDFLDWSRQTSIRFDRIVGNPPYVAIRNLSTRLQASALMTTNLFGGGVPKGANLWVAFLFASLGVLKTGGALGFVLPASWDYATYAVDIKAGMTCLFADLEEHRSQRPLFDQVSDGSVVIIARGFRTGQTSWRRFEHPNRDFLIRCLELERHARTRTNERLVTSVRSQPDCHPLREVIDIRLGGVTGDASYFLLSESSRRRHKLPIECLTPVVSRASHLRGSEIGAREWRWLLRADERTWLFNPPDGCLGHHAVRRYLNIVQSEGGCERSAFKIRNRDPWYRTPLPIPCDGFLSGMSSHGPWVCLRVMRELSATNTLYTIRFRNARTKDEKAAWALSLVSEETRAQLATIGRVYPGGLKKYEPGDLGRIPVLAPARVIGAIAAYKRVITMLCAGHSSLAAETASRWLSGRIQFD
jgi:adenine-specific DNA-methyltransferase